MNLLKHRVLITCLSVVFTGCTIEGKSDVVHNNELNIRGFKLGPKPGVSFRKIEDDKYAIAVIGFRRQPAYQIESKFESLAKAACNGGDWKVEGSRGLKKTSSALVGWEMSGKVVCLT